jgi:hypothetical protein
MLSVPLDQSAIPRSSRGHPAVDRESPCSRGWEPEVSSSHTAWSFVPNPPSDTLFTYTYPDLEFHLLEVAGSTEVATIVGIGPVEQSRDSVRWHERLDNVFDSER